MIQKFIDRWRDSKARPFAEAHPADYEAIVRVVVETVRDTNDDYTPDPARIHRIDDGNYQGTLLFVIAAEGYQPYTYWYTKVGYGSCSGCDTFEAIRDFSDGPPTEKQEADYMSLALHIVEGLRLME